MTIPTGATPEREEVLERIDAVLETLNAFSESQVAFNTKVIERLDRTDDRISKIDERLDRMDERFDRAPGSTSAWIEWTSAWIVWTNALTEWTSAWIEWTSALTGRTNACRTSMDVFDRSDERSDKMEQHLGYLRGAHAANTARQNASLIADDLGYQVITLLPREELIGFAKAAHDAGKAENDVRSFREADLVMLVRDDRGLPAYIAVEASFTVANSDIRRARRNAQYLEEFTGLPAKAAVAGVDIALGREQNAVADGVFCYRIPTRDLEAD